jgi:hypothetical protein
MVWNPVFKNETLNENNSLEIKILIIYKYKCKSTFAIMELLGI